MKMEIKKYHTTTVKFLFDNILYYNLGLGYYFGVVKNNKLNSLFIFKNDHKETQTWDYKLFN